MKKIFSFLLTIALVFSITSCGSKDKLNAEEELLFDALLVASDSFFNPSEMRILGIGDSQYIESKAGAYQCVKVRIQGENKAGGVTSDYYLLYLHLIEGKALATHIAETLTLKEWNDCEDSEYPKKSYSSYDDYKEYKVNDYLKNNFFHSIAERSRAAEARAKDAWYNSASNEYPHTFYKTYDEYLNFLYGYYEDFYYVVKDYDKEISPTKDMNFGKCLILEESYITSSEENIYDISKINKALHDYWDERLGNAD